MFQFLQLRRDQVNGRVYDDLRRWAETRRGFGWLSPLLDDGETILGSERHGDLPRWRKALAALPKVPPFFDGAPSAPRLGAAAADQSRLRALLMELHPWRKGPLELGGVLIDAEWRSDLKWDRVSSHVDLSGRAVLDVGCGNGYFGWRMLAQGADCVVGVDPTLVYVTQWLASRHFAGNVPNFVLPVGVEHLAEGRACFDTVFSMGVLYHRKDPVGHLSRLRELSRPGGQVVLETLVLERSAERELVPTGRYARMRNVRSVPSLPLLRRWLTQAGLPGAELLDLAPTTGEEQRVTGWMRFESLEHCLDPADPTRTVEGHPAPVRAALLVEVPR